MNALVTRADALLALLTFPFVIAVVCLIAGAVWLAAFRDREADELAPLSPETQAARESLRAAAWGGGERG